MKVNVLKDPFTVTACEIVLIYNAPKARLMQPLRNTKNTMKSHTFNKPK